MEQWELQVRLCSRLALLCIQHGTLSPEPEKASAPFPEFEVLKLSKTPQEQKHLELH